MPIRDRLFINQVLFRQSFQDMLRRPVSPDQAWEVPGPGGKLAPDRSRKSEYTDFINQGRLDVGDVNKAWLEEFMNENGLTSKDLKAGL